MNEVMALYRPVFGTRNRWTMLIDGTARAAIEAALVSLLAPGDRVLVVSHGRFGLLLTEILSRIGAVVATVDAPWGQVVGMDAIGDAIERTGPRVVAAVHGDTSTTMVQPLDGLGALCRRAGALCYVDATATIGGMEKGSIGRDNRMFVEGVLWVVRTGSPWRDLPEVFGEWNSVFRRFSRWSHKGVWCRISEMMSDDPDFECLIVDSTIIRAHHHAAGAKKEGLPIRPLAVLAAA